MQYSYIFMGNTINLQHDFHDDKLEPRWVYTLHRALYLVLYVCSICLSTGALKRVNSHENIFLVMGGTSKLRQLYRSLIKRRKNNFGKRRWEQIFWTNTFFLVSPKSDMNLKFLWDFRDVVANVILWRTFALLQLDHLVF